MGKRRESNNVRRRLGMVMSGAMSHNRVVFLTWILLENFHEIFNHSNSKLESEQCKWMLEMWKQRGQPLSYILEQFRYSKILGKNSQTSAERVYDWFPMSIWSYVYLWLDFGWIKPYWWKTTIHSSGSKKKKVVTRYKIKRNRQQERSGLPLLTVFTEYTQKAYQTEWF